MPQATHGHPAALPHVDAVVRQLAQLVHPTRIYLYNRKVSMQEGSTTSFKLAVIAPVRDKCATEVEIYRQVDSEVPFDILLYTPEEWETLSSREGAFAQQIKRTGTILYG